MRVLRGLFGCLENVSCSDQNEVFFWCDSVIWVFFVVLKGKGEKGSAIEPRWWVRMGRLFVVTLDGGRVYSCKHCKTHFAYANQIISKVSPNATTLSYFSFLYTPRKGNSERTGKGLSCFIAFVLFFGALCWSWYFHSVSGGLFQLQDFFFCSEICKLKEPDFHLLL